MVNKDEYINNPGRFLAVSMR